MPPRTLSSSLYPTMKRLLDVVGATLLLLGACPLMGVIALAVWLEDGRPILFTQQRAGQHGSLFTILKFRTLQTGPKNPTRPSDYTTQIGGLLRRWAMDELPQLWNVLRGDMSLVGPRPPLPTQVEKYTAQQRKRLTVRPGLTGWAQIHGRNALPWSDRIELDVWYVRNRSLVLDLRILLRTPSFLLTHTGVSGPDGRNPPLRQRDSSLSSS